MKVTVRVEGWRLPELLQLPMTTDPVAVTFGLDEELLEDELLDDELLDEDDELLDEEVISVPINSSPRIP